MSASRVKPTDFFSIVQDAPFAGIRMQHNYDEVRAVLAAFITKDLMRRPSYPLRYDEPMVKGGLVDSMAFVQIAMFVEQRFGVSIPDADLTVERAGTLGQIVNRVLQG